MIYVTSLDGSQVEPLTNISTDFKMQQSVDGAFSVSFTTTPSDNPGYDILGSEAVITADGYDFKVKQFNNLGYYKRVTAISTFFENSKVQVEGVFAGSHSLENHLNFTLAGTGWSFTVDSSVANILNYINDFGNGNVISLINKICKYHQVEFIILRNNRIHVAKQIGGDYDYQYRYMYNISDVVLVEDTTNLYTYIKGYGHEGLAVSYTSPNEPLFGKKEHDPVRDERFKDAEALTNYIKNTITDVPDLSIESTIPELTQRETGERIWLEYDPLKVSMQTRILKQTKTYRDGKLITESVTLGNTLGKTSMDILVDQQAQINESKEYIDDTKDDIEETIEDAITEINYQFSETETRIIDQYQTITSEYTASISANAREIRTDMAQTETNINKTIGAQYAQITSEYASSISQTAQAIRSDLTASINSVNGSILDVRNYASSIEQSASQIQSTVSSQQLSINSQGSRISSAESSITQQSNLISQKVSESDYNGATIASKIEQSPYYVTIAANKINFQGHVFGQGSTWSGDIRTNTNIHVGNSIYLDGDMTNITSSGGYVGFNVYNDLNISANRTTFYGDVDFSYADVFGLDVGGLTASTSSSGGKTYITFRQNGTYLGMVATA